MTLQTDHNNEQRVALAFNAQSAIFDELYSSNSIIDYKRKRVREHILERLKPGSDILELNAGTGDDAIYLANQGYHVHATDISSGMQKQLMEKLITQRMRGLVTNEICSFTRLENLKNRGPFDCIFSNFAGLNCTGDLHQILADFDGLLKPGGIIVLVILPGFCLWETALILKGKIKTATRRFFSSRGRTAKIEGIPFTCWYYSPAFIKRSLKDQYKMIGLEGLCTIVPPSYIEGFPEKHPKTYSWLCKMENRFKSRWPWKYIGDYFIISFQKP